MLSSGLFINGFVDVVGFPWCKGQKKRIGLASFVQNSLCHGHNSRLSDVDSVGIIAFRALNPGGAAETSTNHSATVSGRLFERWFVKSVLNVLSDGVVGFAEAVVGPSALHWVFGTEFVQPPVGFYAEDLAGFLLPASDDLAVVGHESGTNQLVGATVVMQGLRFLVWLRQDFAPHAQMFQPQKAPLLYRPTDVHFAAPRLGNFDLNFRW